jgi:hypothetical protein
MKILIAIFMCLFLIGCSQEGRNEEAKEVTERRKRQEFEEKNRRRDINIFEQDESECKHPISSRRGDNVIVWLKRNKSGSWQWHLKEKCTCCVDLFEVNNQLKMNELGDYIHYTRFDFVGCRPGRMTFEYYYDDSQGRKIDRTFTVILEREKND